MFARLKQSLYFPLAGYFRFWASIQLGFWHPRVIVVTGSSGKTTAIHLIEALTGNLAHYSRHANSAYGIPFDILGLRRTSYHPLEWLGLFLFAPFCAFRLPYAEKIYLVEADCDRPGEGEFLSKLLRPEVTIWISSDKTHSRQFDLVVERGEFRNIEEAVAYHFGFFAAKTTRLVMGNTDNPRIKKELERSRAKLQPLTLSELTNYNISLTGSVFEFKNRRVTLPYLLPKEIGYGVLAAYYLSDYLQIPFDDYFSAFELPPGRSSLLKGVKNTTLIDSSYNSNLASAAAILTMVKNLNPTPLWLILGDFMEQGSQEKTEHGRLASLVETMNFDRLIFVGPAVARDIFPRLSKKLGEKVISVERAIEAYNYLSEHLVGGETLVFKGTRYLEGVVEKLLADPADVAKLCRQEPIWKEARLKSGF